METSRFNVLHFGLAHGIVCGLALGVPALVARLTGFGYNAIMLLNKLCGLYAPTFKGTIYGGVAGLIGGFIAGAIFAWIYNQLQARCKASGG